jgi:prophage regulatory protein
MNSTNGDLFLTSDAQPLQEAKPISQNPHAALRSAIVPANNTTSSGPATAVAPRKKKATTSKSKTETRQSKKSPHAYGLATDIRERLLRRPEVEHLTGLSRSSLYRLITANEFPVGVNLSKNAVAWTASSVDEWIAARARAPRVKKSIPSKKG